MHKFNVKIAIYEGDYKIFFTFDDGEKGIVDLKNFIFDENCGIFKRLQNINDFKDFSINSNTVAWGDDLDLAPEFLHDLVIEQNQK